MINPLVSIIIPTLNRAHLIVDTIKSIEKQSYKNWECIVVDDGSTDNTVEVVSAFAKLDQRIKILKRAHKNVTGANACRNYGFDIAKGKYINFFDSDDIMHKNKLEFQVSILEKDPCDFNVCQTFIFQNNDLKNVLLRCPYLKSLDPFNDFLSHKIKWLTQAPLLRAEVIRRIGIRFDESLQQSQELDYFGRLLAHTTSYSIIEKPLVYVREHQDSISYGAVTAEKIISSFNVRLNFAQNYNAIISSYCRSSLIKEAIALYALALRNTRLFKKEQLNIMYRSIKLELHSSKSHLILWLMKNSFTYFNKGDFFKSKLQAVEDDLYWSGGK